MRETIIHQDYKCFDSQKEKPCQILSSNSLNKQLLLRFIMTLINQGKLMIRMSYRSLHIHNVENRGKRDKGHLLLMHA